MAIWVFWGTRTLTLKKNIFFHIFFSSVSASHSRGTRKKIHIFYIFYIFFYIRVTLQPTKWYLGIGGLEGSKLKTSLGDTFVSQNDDITRDWTFDIIGPCFVKTPPEWGLALDLKTLFEVIDL